MLEVQMLANVSFEINGVPSMQATSDSKSTEIICDVVLTQIAAIQMCPVQSQVGGWGVGGSNANVSGVHWNSHFRFYPGRDL